MSLETDTDVRELATVQDEQGNSKPPVNLRAIGNRDTLTGFTYSTSSTNDEALDSYSVPHGSTVLVVPDPGNAGTVYVGPDGVTLVPLADAGDSFGADVLDTSEISVRTPNSGDTVGVMWEADN